ncbi:glycosyl hydrolase family 28-related protein [Paenibacillus glycinis]|uniref:Pectate lyase superfamily protein domain-containing protein n=1 Tax=Paenibacillus glycinis TaxID=2697035 RepID=A0ABW9XLU0_9BACL|nr:glycosyl hydrolase family 28-related protein [Paenibacillus glycinis]NBD23595.1 hypothetical protein [Paenibacillus glycinis]
MSDNDRHMMSRRKLLISMAAVGVGVATGNILPSLLNRNSKEEGDYVAAAVMADKESRLVTDYGAVGDGVKDNTQSFQSAINDAVAKGYKLVIPSGRFLIKGTLVNLDNVSMHGVSLTKNYWRQDNYDDFEKGASVLIGTGKNALFGKKMSRAAFTGICFSKFGRIADPSSPRYVLFQSCSFKDVTTVLDAPSNQTAAYHNFKFVDCAFTVYRSSALFSGRILDSMWDRCVFVGSNPMELTQAKANQVTNSRFEWIDRGTAISLYACEQMLFNGNYFDRISGAAFEIKQGNKEILITGNQFNRCGSGLSSAGDSLNYKDLNKSFIILYGEFTDVNISANTFSKNASGDHDGEPCPKYVLAKRAGIADCTLRFYGNDVENGYTKTFLYVEDKDYSSILIKGEKAFQELSQHVIDMAKCSNYNIEAACTSEVKLSEVPSNLIVHNKSAIKIEGKQLGTVFGGTVNGYPRYDRPEIIYEETGPKLSSSNGADKLSGYSIPITRMLHGVQLTISFVYVTSGSPNMKISASISGSTDIKLPDLTGAAQRKLYVANLYVPFQSNGKTLQINYGALGSLKGSVQIYAFAATYASFTPKSIYDQLG